MHNESYKFWPRTVHPYTIFRIGSTLYSDTVNLNADTFPFNADMHPPNPVDLQLLVETFAIYVNVSLIAKSVSTFAGNITFDVPFISLS